MTKTLHQPISGNEMPRFAGPATMMRLPQLETAAELDVGFVGIPFDSATSNRPGCRYGPRQIRAESSFLRSCNVGTKTAPFEHLAVADLGDVPVNTFSIEKTVAIIESFYDGVLSHGCRPLSMGGDHMVSLPVLRAIARKHGPVALVHIDAHADMNEHHFGEAITHGTTFRRAVEEGLVQSERYWQIGVRGTGWSADEFGWAREQGVHVVQAEEIWYKSLAPLMAQVRDSVGDQPVYLSFDIDGLDPSLAPGVGSIELGGLTAPQAVEAIRGLCGLNLVGGDLVEVAPMYDTSGNTALIAANLLFEMLCAMPGAQG